MRLRKSIRLKKMSHECWSEVASQSLRLSFFCSIELNLRLKDVPSLIDVYVYE